MKVFKVTRPDLGTGLSCVYDSFNEIVNEFDGSEIGDSITVELCEMTDMEFEEIGDFPGW